MPSAQWQFRGACEDSRLRALAAATSFQGIVDTIAHGMTILCSHTQESVASPTHQRQIYCAEIVPQAFDIFFNSQSGYRGAYFESPERGVAANSELLSAVRARLVSWTRRHCSDQDPEFALESLAAKSAKVWLAEDTLHLCSRCEGQWNNSTRADAEILNGRWELDSSVEAKWGRQAYLFTKIRFLGAFLDDSGDEFIPPHKLFRAQNICAKGWA